MRDIEVITDPAVAVVALDPVRSQLLAELREPASAAELAGRVGVARQKINYHVRQLEAHGLVEAAGSRTWGGLTERRLVATAAGYVVSPSALGLAGGGPDRVRDRLSVSYLISLAARLIRELGDLSQAAARRRTRLPVYGLDSAIRFATPADRAAFAEELTAAVTGLTAKYHDESTRGGRWLRLMISIHPVPAGPTCPRPKRPKREVRPMTDDRPAGRYAETETVVAGTPEEVWQAIATGPGHAAWAFAADIEPAVGGKMIIHREPFAPDAEVTVTRYEPPRAFSFAESNPGVPSPLTTEILVKARSGDTCVVRVVCGLADVGDEWEDLVDGVTEGWRMSLLMLRAYLQSFPGRRAQSIDVITMIDPAPADRNAPAEELFDRLGLLTPDRLAGQRFTTAAGAPELSGVVEHASDGYLLLRSESPYPGLLAISCFSMGQDQPISINLLGRVYAALDADRLGAVAGAWRHWLDEQSAQLARAGHPDLEASRS